MTQKFKLIASATRTLMLASTLSVAFSHAHFAMPFASNQAKAALGS